MSALLSLTDSISEAVFSLIGSLLYPIFNIFYFLIDTVQNIFYAFAGLGNVTINGVAISFDVGRGGFDSSGNYQNGFNGSDTQNGILYYIFRTQTVRNILVSMIILGLVLLIVFTVLAFIRNVYQPKQKKWQEIVSSSLKGLIHFFVLPVFCLLGVLAGNALLKVLDDATSGGDNVAISRQLFLASSYSANAFRYDEKGDGLNNDDHSKTYTAFKSLCNNSDNSNKTWAKVALQKLGSEYNITQNEYYAEVMDEAFRSADGPSIFWSHEVSPYYNLWNINYLALAAGGIFILFVLGSISFGMVKRLFMLTVLFVISPAICSMYPLDDGSSVNKWKGDFIKNFFMAYGAVIGLNLYFLILPVINSIDITGDPLGIVPLLLTIAGLFVVRDLVSLISGYVHGDDAYGTGASLFNNVKSRVKKGTAWTGKRVAGAVGVFTRATGASHARDEYFMKKVAGDDAARKEGESWSQYKKRIEDNKIGGGWDALSNAAKARRESASGDEKREAGSGFAGGLGAGLKDTGLNILDSIMGSTGFGKARDFSKAYTEGEKRGYGDKSKKIKTEKEVTDYAKNQAQAEKVAQEGVDEFKKALGNGDYSKIMEMLGSSFGEAILKGIKNDKTTGITFTDPSGKTSVSNGTINDVFKALNLDPDTVTASGLSKKLGIVDDAQKKAERVGDLTKERDQFTGSNWLQTVRKEMEDYEKIVGPSGGSAGDKVKWRRQLYKGYKLNENTGNVDMDNFAKHMNEFVDKLTEKRESLNSQLKEANIEVQKANTTVQKELDPGSAFAQHINDFANAVSNAVKDIDLNKAINTSGIEKSLADLINEQKEIANQIKRSGDKTTDEMRKAIEKVAKGDKPK